MYEESHRRKPKLISCSLLLAVSPPAGSLNLTPDFTDDIRVINPARAVAVFFFKVLTFCLTGVL